MQATSRKRRDAGAKKNHIWHISKVAVGLRIIAHKTLQKQSEKTTNKKVKMKCVDF